MGKKDSSDEGAKAAKAGLCACGICCALCIGIPLLIIIIIIIIIVVVVGNASDDISTALSGCGTIEKDGGACNFDHECRGNRSCTPSLKKCEGSHNC